MRFTEKNRIILPALMALLILATVGLTGCGGEKIQVTIQENNVTTKLESTPGRTVQEILDEAELKAGDQDEVSPAADTTVTEDGAAITLKRHAAVSIVDEDHSYDVELCGATVDEALQEAGITLGRDDSVDCNRAAYLQEGMTIHVTRVRHIVLKVNGTVKDLFAEQDIEIGKEDRLNVTESDRIEEGAKIVLDLVSTKEEKVTEDIPYETQTKYSAALNKGTSQVTRAGVTGKKEVTYRVTYVNGQEEKRTKVSEKVLQQPVAQIVTQGTKAVRTVVSRQKVLDCDGSGHGYYIIKYSDGTESYQTF